MVVLVMAHIDAHSGVAMVAMFQDHHFFFSGMGLGQTDCQIGGRAAEFTKNTLLRFGREFRKQ